MNHITHDVMFELVIDDQFLLDKGVLMYKQMDRSDLEFQTVANSFSINDFKNVTFQSTSTKTPLCQNQPRKKERLNLPVERAPKMG
ncbi:hypothetical protein AVEN_49370-1 [Araneus ventricosus]|uniref:Uncharacterized protein n=1 Tax=Araneus ventricosus TaxID=182803 RepID=A0A4Y2LQJ7_ARAVE|nr:hypothetical protein AVEN_49370-1 [Araneus ventricosus]